ncbi:MAG TPA: glycosyltransferase family 4 protein [Waterburya sp.]|jgi:glycosyltransferase involved in cell wall biosynthesis
MNVLHINYSDIYGGAAIAGYRLHQGLLDQGIDSRLLVAMALTRSERVAIIPRKPTLENLLYRFAWRVGLNYLNCVSTFDIPKHGAYKNADILNFHNLHAGYLGYFNYLVLPLLTKNKPAIFTLHDMWSFTGHCAYSYDCERWKVGCGNCPYLDAEPIVFRDNTHLAWKLKNAVYHRSNLTFVAPSRWLFEQAKQSMLSQFPIHHIPYGIDTKAYQPLDSEACRAVLGIPKHKKVLLFGSVSLENSRKGGDLLLEALSKLPESLKADIMLLIFGENDETITKALGMQVLSLGYLSKDCFKSLAFSAADLLIFPTRADNLPVVVQESLACGTPIVSFNLGGVSDLVRPGLTGYLAQPEDTNELCNGIVHLLEDHSLRQRMGQQCREIALQEYSLELQAHRYIELYNQVLRN